jgi:hypothetical protein
MKNQSAVPRQRMPFTRVGGFAMLIIAYSLFMVACDSLTSPMEDYPHVDRMAKLAATSSATNNGIGGPVILMGLDSELTPGQSSHGTPAEHAAMVESLLSNVTNGGVGILVIGDGPNIRAYWEGDVGNAPNVNQPVTFVSGADDILAVDFDGYAMLGIASSTFQLPGTNGINNVENDALIQRRDDIANFVNGGGGLLGKTQDQLTNAWGYVDPFGDFSAVSASFSRVIVEQAGLDLGLTQQGMDGWCCYHEVLTSFPGFFDVLITHNAGGALQGEAAAIGGVQVVIPTQISLSIDGATETDVGATEEYDVRLTNIGDDTPENVVVEFTLTRSGGIEAGDLHLEWFDPNDNEWKELALTEDNGSLSGTFGPAGGFPVPEGYDETTEIRATFFDADVFTVNASVVGVGAEQDTYASTSHTVNVLAPPFVEECVDLIAGQHIHSGEVCIINDFDNLYVTYTTTDGWMLNESHLAVSSDEVGTGEWSENGWTNRQGNPAPGRFAYSAGHDPDSDDTFTYTIPLDDITGGVSSGDELFIGAHAVVVMGDETETAWGDGERFNDQGNWAMYFEYTVQ